MARQRGNRKSAPKDRASQFAELARLIPPPSSPVAVRGDWSTAEAAHGVNFPDDFKQVVAAYGSGRFFGFLWAYSPFDPAPDWSFSCQLQVAAENLRAYKQEGFQVPFPVYPEPGGLVPFGSTENCNYLCWRTKGEPNDWSLVIWDTDYLTAWTFPEWGLAGLLLELAHHRHPMLPNSEGKLFPEDLFKAPGFVSEQHGG